MVGSPQVINCTVSTISGVESSSVMISWMGPGGNIDTTNGRMSIGSVTDDGNNTYTRSLQFTYLMEGDEGNYTCNVTILDASVTQSIELQSLTGKYFVSYKLKINIHTYLKLLFLFLTNNFAKFNTQNFKFLYFVFHFYSLN